MQIILLLYFFHTLTHFPTLTHCPTHSHKYTNTHTLSLQHTLIGTHTMHLFKCSQTHIHTTRTSNASADGIPSLTHGNPNANSFVTIICSHQRKRFSAVRNQSKPTWADSLFPTFHPELSIVLKSKRDSPFNHEQQVFSPLLLNVDG